MVRHPFVRRETVQRLRFLRGVVDRSIQDTNGIGRHVQLQDRVTRQFGVLRKRDVPRAEHHLRLLEPSGTQYDSRRNSLMEQVDGFEPSFGAGAGEHEDRVRMAERIFVDEKTSGEREEDAQAQSRDHRRREQQPTYRTAYARCCQWNEKSGNEQRTRTGDAPRPGRFRSA
jgi:hypothetical protein